MTNKEFNLRVMAFMVIGILLFLSLGICIYIVNSERDLVPISADVIDVEKDTDGTGKNDVTVSYKVNNTFYEYSFYYKDDVNIDDKIDIYYHSENITSVKANKTSKLIFLFPILGLIFCVIGLLGLFKKNNKVDDEDEFKTKVISIIGDTQQLEIITDDEETDEYVKSPEEEEEVSVKSISVKENTVVEDEVEFQKKTSKTEEKVEEQVVKDDVVQEKLEESQVEEFASVDTPKKEKFKLFRREVKEDKNDVEVSENTKVKEEIKEVKKELIKLIPKYYYVTGSTLVYDVVGKEGEELDLNKVVKVVKTINSENELVKVNVITDEISCLLTNMFNVELEVVANTIHNRLVAIDSTFKEEIEYKEW